MAIRLIANADCAPCDTQRSLGVSTATRDATSNLSATWESSGYCDSNVPNVPDNIF